MSIRSSGRIRYFLGDRHYNGQYFSTYYIMIFTSFFIFNLREVLNTDFQKQSSSFTSKK